jgi:1-acyl-sn-glycerol-3-phosphate acyltransferase
MDTLITVNNINKQLKQNQDILTSPISGLSKYIMAKDPLYFSSSLLNKINTVGQSGEISDNYQLIDGYIFNKQGNEAYIAISSKYPVSETSKNAILIESIEKAIENTQHNIVGNKLAIDYIGASAISVDNAKRIKTDSLISTTLAIALILILLIYFFRDFRAILIICFSIVFGSLFALAFLALLKGSVSVIAIGIGSVIVGIAVNYPLHFLAHLQQATKAMPSDSLANRKSTIFSVLKEIVPPLVTGNITTVGAFLSIMFISSDAMRDLGLFASLLLVGTILFVLVFAAHLFKTTLFSSKKVQHSNTLLNKVADLDIEKNKFVIWSVVILTIPLFILSGNTSFETDMNAINYVSDSQRAKLNKMIAQTQNQSTVYCVSQADNMQSSIENNEIAEQKIEQLIADSLITKSSGLKNFIPSSNMQKHKIEMWNRYWEGKKDTFINNLRQIASKYNFSASATEGIEGILEKDYTIQKTDYFQPILASFASNYIYESGENCLIFSTLEVKKENIEKVETLLNSIKPQQVSNQNSSIFAFENRKIFDTMIEALSSDFNYVLYVCGIIVFLFLTFSFGRLELSIIAFTPLIIGWIWILGIMGLFDIKFNIVNIILATFIFGQGDDYTIFVTEGLIHEHTCGKKMLAHYKQSILLSAIIMLISIGSLIFAKHPAMHSLAEVTIIGMFCVVLMAYLFPPLMFKWLTTRNNKQRSMPITALNFAKTIFAFVVFVVGTLVLTLIGFVLITLCGKSKQHKEMYHICLCKTFRFLVKVMPQVDYHLTNERGNDLDKCFACPSIIISNHQSHLDLLYLLSLSPKIVCLTNKWVWNCPFYGWIIRYADFICTDNLNIADEQSNEKGLNKIKTLIADGYSILIFPEGRRSEDCSIRRFHQGAFYLADKLNVGILPIIIHGIGHVFPKTEFSLRKGRVDVRIINTPKFENNTKTYIAIASAWQKEYQSQYDKIAQQIETADYFASLVYHNYIYKGRKIEAQVKQNLKKEANYAQQIAALPDNGIVHIDNCGL